MSRIASPIFNGASSDKLAAVDVYETTTPALRNNFKPAVSAFGQSIEKNLGKQNDLLSDIGKAVKGNSIDLAEARQTMLETIRGSRGLMDKTTKGFQQEILKEIGQSTTGKPIRISGYDQSVDLGYGEMGNAQAIAGLLGDLTGNTDLFEVVNLGAEAALFRGAIEEISKWGIPELIDDVLQEIEDEKLKRDIVQKSAYRIVNTADIDSIETYINAVGASALVSLFPDAPRQLLQQYRFKPGVTPANYPALLTQLVNVLNQLKPDWFQVQRGSETVWNLSLINTASDAARLLFLSDGTYRVPIMIAPEYPSKAVKSIIKGMYPMIAMTV